MNAAGFSHRKIAAEIGVADERSVENLLGLPAPQDQKVPTRRRRLRWRSRSPSER
jgi:hypothetical protein